MQRKLEAPGGPVPFPDLGDAYDLGSTDPAADDDDAMSDEEDLLGLEACKHGVQRDAAA
jgi:hypothetical protein